jgi:hypothetical protein
MKPATILRIHSIISSALDLAVPYGVGRRASPEAAWAAARRPMPVMPGGNARR